MKVLFLTHAFPRFDGDVAGGFLLRLASALGTQGVDVKVVAPASAGAADNAKLNGTGIARFHYAPRKYETLAYGGNMAEQVRDSWSARFTLLGFLGAEFRSAVRARRAMQPDIVHAHWWFPSGLVGTWLSKLSHTPLVTTLHGTDVRIARSVSMSRPAFRHVLQNSRATTAVSRWLAHEAQSIVSAPAPVVAPMPVATELFSPGGQRKKDTLLFVGRLKKQKGLDLLLHSLAKLPAPISLDVVGDGEEREPLEQLARELGVASRVRWHGSQPQEELVKFYRAASAVVVPSADEGLGLVAGGRLRVGRTPGRRPARANGVSGQQPLARRTRGGHLAVAVARRPRTVAWRRGSHARARHVRTGIGSPPLHGNLSRRDCELPHVGSCSSRS